MSMMIPSLASSAVASSHAVADRWRAAADAPSSGLTAPAAATPAGSSAATGADRSSVAAGASVDQLSAQEQQLLAQLVQVDRLVRAHEQAHLAAGAGLVRGGVSFSYQSGPDGKRYAVGGEVSIDVSAASTPQETIAKARQVRAAALAPADPSAQDLNVAASAARMESQALAEIAAQQRAALAEPAAIGAYREVTRSASGVAGLGSGLNVYA